MGLHGSVGCLRSAGGPHRHGRKRDQTFLCIISSKIAVSLCVCNHAQFYKLNVYFFCRIDADGHQNRWRPSSTPTSTFHEDRNPFPFLSLTALFLFCAPSLGFFVFLRFIEIILLFRCLSRKNRKTGFLLSWKAKDLGGFRRI